MGVNVFKPLMDWYPEECNYYMDDFGIFTDDTQTGTEWHGLITTEFLQICLDHSLFLWPEKCIFEQAEMDFLGFHICNGEISVDPSKISGIWDYMEQLDFITEVWKFLGVVGYQRPFIWDFARIAWPLHDLIKKNIKYEWTNKHTEAVQWLKKAITTKPVLVLPDQNQQFELETNASFTATGAMLYQREPHPDDTTDTEGYDLLRGQWQVVGYHSQALSPAEHNYPIYDREYLGVIQGLQH